MKIHKEDMNDEFLSYMNKYIINFKYISNERNDCYLVYYNLTLSQLPYVEIASWRDDRYPGGINYKMVDSYFKEHISSLREDKLLNILS